MASHATATTTQDTQTVTSCACAHADNAALRMRSSISMRAVLASRASWTHLSHHSIPPPIHHASRSLSTLSPRLPISPSYPCLPLSSLLSFPSYPSRSPAHNVFKHCYSTKSKDVATKAAAVFPSGLADIHMLPSSVSSSISSTLPLLHVPYPHYTRCSSLIPLRSPPHSLFSLT